MPIHQVLYFQIVVFRKQFRISLKSLKYDVFRLPTPFKASSKRIFRFRTLGEWVNNEMGIK
jgi:hypothetical protein